MNSIPAVSIRTWKLWFYGVSNRTWKLWFYGTLLGIAFGIPFMLVTKIPVSLIGAYLYGIIIGSGLVAVISNRKG